MNRALELQRAGQNESAAEFYEAVLATDPEVPDAHNMLAVIRVAQGRLLDGFRHSRRAGELTGWSNQLINHNYFFVARMALANADAARVARLGKLYREQGNKFRLAADARVSALLVGVEFADALEACFAALAQLERPPYEVLIAADLVDTNAGRACPFPLRTLAPRTKSPYGQLNDLAVAASGDYFLALRCDQLTPRAWLACLRAMRPMAGHWSLAVAEPANNQQLAALLAESSTTGFALLSPLDVVGAAACLLVPKTLHEAINGYQPGSADPLLDYCLRLLWLAEPALVRYLADPAAPGQAPSTIGEHEAVLDGYLRRAFSSETPSNEFAPSPLTWGLHFHSHIIVQGILSSADVMGHMNADIEADLEHKSLHPIRPQPGINLVGPARGEFGLAENMRAFARASMAGGIPCAIRDLNLALNTRQADQSLADHIAEDARHCCSVFFLSPDSRQLYEQSLDAVVFRRPALDFRHVKIGYWFWELERIPPQWATAIAKVDEIWVATEFVAEAIRRVTGKPVIRIPTPIAFEIKGRYDRRHFNLPENVFLFLFSFDFHSFPERKNPYGLIRAFRLAFPPNRKDVALVIKSINGHKKPEATQALMEVADNDPRILLRDGFLGRDEVLGLQSAVDAYVSLHRAEGLGLGLAESMYQGKPVIGTGYSGNLEFMNESNSALVDYTLVPIKKGQYLYDDPGYFWAQPDEEHAAHLMRKMVDDSEYRQRVAFRGQQDILAGFSYAATAERMKSRLREIGVL
jgi:glycosyltransferase involved in cell wall biosynthesis